MFKSDRLSKSDPLPKAPDFLKCPARTHWKIIKTLAWRYGA